MCTQNILGICTAEDLSRNLRVQPARWHITDRLARQASQLSGRRDSNVVFAWTCKCQFAHRCNIAQWNERAFTESTSTTSNRCDLNRFWWEILCCISVKQNTVLWNGQVRAQRITSIFGSYAAANSSNDCFKAEYADLGFSKESVHRKVTKFHLSNLSSKISKTSSPAMIPRWWAHLAVGSASRQWSRTMSLQWTSGNSNRLSDSKNDQIPQLPSHTPQWEAMVE